MVMAASKALATASAGSRLVVITCLGADMELLGTSLVWGRIWNCWDIRCLGADMELLGISCVWGRIWNCWGHHVSEGGYGIVWDIKCMWADMEL